MAFKGWPAEAVEFYEGLEADNSKAYWQDHKVVYEKQVRGCVFGSANPHADIPRLLSLYRSGLLKLDELVTRTYGLHEVNEGYQDMFDGLNVRGVIHHTH